MTHTYAGYVRVSTEEQSKEGLSPEHQIRKIQEYVRHKEGELVHIYQDLGKSGGSITKRQEFQTMLNDAFAGQFTHIVVLRLERFTRSLRDFIFTVDELNKHNVQLQTISGEVDTSTPHGKLYCRFVAMLAEFERDMARVRTEEVQLMKIKQGQPISPPPFGYKWKNKQWVISAKEAAIVIYLFRRIGEGREPKDLIKHLSISKNHMYSILKNRTYLGKLTYKGKEYPGKHKPLITEKEWQNAHANYKPHRLEEYLQK